jgi:hypothetical protein
MNYFKNLSNLQQKLDGIKKLAKFTEHETNIKNKVIVCDKFDKKMHAGYVLILNEKTTDNYDVVHSNLSSKEQIKYNFKLQMPAEYQYEYQVNNKIVKKSFETHTILSNMTNIELDKLEPCMYEKDDMRQLVLSNFQPHAFVRKLSTTYKDNTYLTKLEKDDIQVINVKNESILKNIIAKKLLNHSIIDTAITDYIALSDDLNNDLIYLQ